jgi:hypothetical protein
MPYTARNRRAKWVGSRTLSGGRSPPALRWEQLVPGTTEALAGDPLFEADAGLGADLVQVAQRDVVRGSDRGGTQVGVREVLAHVGPHPGEKRLGQHVTGVAVGVSGGGQERLDQFDAGDAELGCRRIGAEPVGVGHQVGNIVEDQAVERAAVQVADGATDHADGEAELIKRDLAASAPVIRSIGCSWFSRQPQATDSRDHWRVSRGFRVHVAQAAAMEHRYS